jgi:parvulin-like peptidyl-prolyl isomerase
LNHRDTKTQCCRYLALCVFACLWFTLSGNAEVIDRVVAVVEGHVITLSDLRQERQIRAQLGEEPIDEDAALTKQLVDNFLIERQIADYPNLDVTDAEVDSDLEKFNLSASRASDALRNAVRQRIRMQKFFDVRFRQFIRPTDDEIRKYYDEVFLPEARARGMQSIPPLTDPEMEKGIRENVIQENLNHEVDGWLKAIRRRSNVEVFQ